MLAIFQQFGGGEIIVILAILLVLFGAKKLPELGKGMGKGIKEFREGVKGIGDDIDEGMKGDDAASPKGDSRGSSESSD